LAGRVVDQHPPRVLGVARDVTHRREAQSELAEANARFELAAAAAAVAVWDYEFRTRTTRWTGDHHRLTGLPSDAAIDPRAVFRAIHPDDRVRVRDAIAERVAAGESDLELELRFVHGAGRIVWVGVRGRITYGPDGPLDIHGACFDITPRKRLEEERERLLESERYARSDAERATRLKDEFLATLSHELRTPLGAILGWTHLLRNRPYDAAKVHQGLEVIERNARVQTELIADLLDMSRILSGKMRLDVQRVDLTAVIDAAIEAVRPAADAREIRLERSDAATVELDGDPSRLQQVVWNLLSNAVKFTPRGGSVAVGITAVGSWVEVTVRDTGAGIDPAFLPYVFERFRQADASSARVHGGLGLGLAIVKHLVELHGGRVAAHSEGEGRGAAFLVELPQAGVALAEDDPSSFGDDPRTPSPAPPIDAERLRGLRVLVVDDEPDARDIVRRLLEEYAIEVFTAASADDGLALLATARPDLVVSDIGMPHKDGYQFIAAIRGRSDPVVAVALTAFARPEDRDRALAAGYQAHLAKPVRPTELLSTLSTLAVAAAGSRRG
ncbi:MAG: ATP-binding protein, partial [Myxococcota bacterium]